MSIQCEMHGCTNEVSLATIKRQKELHPKDPVYICKYHADDLGKKGWRTNGEDTAHTVSIPDQPGYHIDMRKNNAASQRTIANMKLYAPKLFRCYEEGIPVLEHRDSWCAMISPVLLNDQGEFRKFPLQTRIKWVFFEHRYEIWEYRNDPVQLDKLYQQLCWQAYRCRWSECTSVITFWPGISQKMKGKCGNTNPPSPPVKYCDNHQRIRCHTRHHLSSCNRIVSHQGGTQLDISVYLKKIEEIFNGPYMTILDVLHSNLLFHHNWWHLLQLDFLSRKYREGAFPPDRLDALIEQGDTLCLWPGCINVAQRTWRMLPTTDDKQRGCRCCLSHRKLIVNIASWWSRLRKRFPALFVATDKGNFLEQRTGCSMTERLYMWMGHVSNATGVSEFEYWVVAWAVRLLIEDEYPEEVVKSIKNQTRLDELSWDYPVLDQRFGDRNSRHTFFWLQTSQSITQNELDFWQMLLPGNTEQQTTQGERQ